ncbi:MAG: HD domain-containing protein [Lachnospiraceae bacterium]|nr:HD domain-containing protein [Lachnospiraceae bacterium]
MKKIRRLLKKLADYLYDPSVNIGERTFVMLSLVVLISLYAAIPCGMIMQEPILATISTLIGAIVFTVYVVYAVAEKKIARAKVVISFVLVFVFLPAMFFTNGGIYGGTPIWLLLGTIYICLILEGRFKGIMLTLDAIVIVSIWVVGYEYPDLITVYSRAGNYFDSIAGLFIVSFIIYAMISFQNNLYRKDMEEKNLERLFDQTTMSLVKSLELKDKYTRGHSIRVAEYSKKIAEELGKTAKEQEEIYYVALLHDVGKMGVNGRIINKKERLTAEEYEEVKQHSVMGAELLSCISEYPFLSVGALYHHERYDGKGYPFGMKGTDIPEVARIISVAEAYDSMTSKSSYSDPLTQDRVREELIEGSGSQFDPEIAKIMLHMIDLDTEFEMKEREEIKQIAGGKDDLTIDAHRDEISEGIVLNPFMTTIHMKVTLDKKNPSHHPMPSMILYDSLDGRYHADNQNAESFMYYEYCEIFFNGKCTEKGVRKLQSKVAKILSSDSIGPNEYRIEAIKIRDHVLVRITGTEQAVEVIVALPDSTRFVYMGLTGEACHISDVKIEKSENAREPGFIHRIAEEISYIDGPVGDVPNVQVDSYRTDTTEGIEIEGNMKITFHAKSLPTARLVWHCPYFVIYSSKNGQVNGEDYTEYALIRLDGESWEAGNTADNNLIVDRHDFDGWDEWKKINKEGYDCTVTFERNDRKIITRTINGGISIKNTSLINTDAKKIYVSLTGDQCALTNIRIERQ